MVELLHAIILGFVEGITEFLPISSTGHLLLTEKALQFKDTTKVFTVIIQLGAILAVVWQFREDILSKIKGFVTGDIHDRHFGISLIIATIPAGILGLFFNKIADKHESVMLISGALFFGGVVLLWVDSHVKTYKRSLQYEMEDMRYRQALIIGLAQSVSLIPGISRSGASITGGLLVGLNRRSATTFSFYLGIPIMFLASSYKLAKEFDSVGDVSGGWPAIVLGFVVSAIIASIVIKWLLGYVSRNTFKIFAVYRIILAIILFSLVYNNVISNK